MTAGLIKKSMSKRKIILLTHKMTVGKYYEAEVEFLEKEFDLEMHECIDFTYPMLKYSYGSSIKSSNIKVFKSLKTWKNYINNLINNEPNNKIIIFNLISQYNCFGPGINIFLLDFFLKKKKLIIYKFEIPAFPSYKLDKNYSKNFFNIQIDKVKSFFLTDYMFTLKRILTVIMSKIGHYLEIYPNYLLVGGRRRVEKIKEEKIKNMKIIEGTDRNCSKIFINSKILNEFKKNNYITFIDDRDPTTLPDQVIFTKAKPKGKNEDWYIKINKFFNKIESILNKEVVIAAHPKSNMNIVKEIYKGRSVYQNRSYELIKNSDLVITEKSSAISYAIYLKKPLFFICTNETKKNFKNLKEIKFITGLLNSNVINIDDYLKNEKKFDFFKLSTQKYNDFIDSYLLSSYNKIPNYKLLIDSINKN